MQLGHEPTPYKKKKIKRPPKKSDHKHIYKDVIGIVEDDYFAPMPCKKCTICGKTEIVHLHYAEKTSDHLKLYRALSLEEIKEKFPELEIVNIKL